MGFAAETLGRLAKPSRYPSSRGPPIATAGRAYLAEALSTPMEAGAFRSSSPLVLPPRGVVEDALDHAWIPATAPGRVATPRGRAAIARTVAPSARRATMRPTIGAASGSGTSTLWLLRSATRSRRA